MSLSSFVYVLTMIILVSILMKLYFLFPESVPLKIVRVSTQQWTQITLLCYLIYYKMEEVERRCPAMHNYVCTFLYYKFPILSFCFIRTNYREFFLFPDGLYIYRVLKNLFA